MPAPEQPAPATWAGSVAAAVGRQVAHYREQRGLTAQQLSAALAEIGLDLKRTVIGNLESGYRRTVSVPEVLALAEVLQVPPLLLLVPLGQASTVEVTPGRVVDTWDAARWIAGEGQPADGSAAELVDLYRRHDRAVADWIRWQGRGLGTAEDAEDATARELVNRRIRRAEEERSDAEERLWFIRRAIAGHGALLPQLPAELVHVGPGAE